ncbi:MAG TPA: hypothetical protein VFR14_05930 [Candidatus Limnocylindrales bacterium]|nr:hypothetical protein [Candidatus Limnocylindrales bacterium]
MNRTVAISRLGHAGVLATAALLGWTVATASGGELASDVEVWLDHPLPSDASPGHSIAIGGMVWHPESRTSFGRPVFVRVHPADGIGEPVEVHTTEDWPGHFMSFVLVPAGGFGQIEIGTAGSACVGSVCTRSDAIYPIGGVGPPPGIALTEIARAEITLPAEHVVAGRPATVQVWLEPRASWDPALVPLPDRLAIELRRPRGPVLLEASADLVDRPSATYRAVVVLREIGDLLVQAGIAADSAAPVDTTVLFASIERLSVGPEVGTAAPDPATPGRGDQAGAPLGIDPALLIGLAVIVLAMAAVGFASRRPAG